MCTFPNNTWGVGPIGFCVEDLNGDVFLFNQDSRLRLGKGSWLITPQGLYLREEDISGLCSFVFYTNDCIKVLLGQYPADARWYESPHGLYLSHNDQIFFVDTGGNRQDLGLHPHDDIKSGPLGLYLVNDSTFSIITPEGIKRELGRWVDDFADWYPAPDGIYIEHGIEDIITLLRLNGTTREFAGHKGTGTPTFLVPKGLYIEEDDKITLFMSNERELFVGEIERSWAVGPHGVYYRDSYTGDFLLFFVKP